jgi:transcriptional regulator with XRE-family HTH domain
MPVDYREFFRNLRKARGFTHETLAERAGCHRNTVLNVERRRPVKFRTIIELMAAMGFDQRSDEVRRMALLWLESVSGIGLTLDEMRDEAKGLQVEYREAVRGANKELEAVLAKRKLSEEQIRLLVFAAGHPEILETIRHIRDLLGNLGRVNGEPRRPAGLTVGEG